MPSLCQITFPHACGAGKIPVLGGFFIASGVGPPGRIRHLTAELYRVISEKDEVRVDCGVSVPRVEDVHQNSEPREGRFRFVVLFDLSNTSLTNDPYRIKLYVGSNPTHLEPDDTLTLPGLNKIYEAVNVYYPSNNSTLAASGFSCYGSVGNSEVVTSAKVGDVASADGGMQDSGFWWRTFNQLTSGNGQQLTVSGSMGSLESRVINLV